MTETLPAKPRLSIILPAHNEGRFITACLDALLASDPGDYTAEVIVVANACTDDTVDLAQGFAAQADARGWKFRVIDSPQPGKLAALNLGDQTAQGMIRAYLDADVVVSPPLLGQLVKALACKEPRYASGTPIVAPARTGLTRAYGRFWAKLPFVTHGVPGFGLFAVNVAGRARWRDFPDIISDDTFVRLSFAPNERQRLPATYSWPMVEGFSNLVRVRRRQDDGVAQIAAQFPELLGNDDTPEVGLGGLCARALRDPLGLVAYAVVKLAVRTRFAQNTQVWARGR